MPPRAKRSVTAATQDASTDSAKITTAITDQNMTASAAAITHADITRSEIRVQRSRHASDARTQLTSRSNVARADASRRERLSGLGRTHQGGDSGRKIRVARRPVVDDPRVTPGLERAEKALVKTRPDRRHVNITVHVDADLELLREHPERTRETLVAVVVVQEKARAWQSRRVGDDVELRADLRVSLVIRLALRLPRERPGRDGVRDRGHSGATFPTYAARMSASTSRKDVSAASRWAASRSSHSTASSACTSASSSRS